MDDKLVLVDEARRHPRFSVQSIEEMQDLNVPSQVPAWLNFTPMPLG